MCIGQSGMCQQKKWITLLVQISTVPKLSQKQCCWYCCGRVHPVSFLEGAAAKFKRETERTRRTSYWSDGKDVLLECWKSVLRSEWKSVVLEWLEERRAGVTGRTFSSFAVEPAAVLVLLVLVVLLVLLVSVCPLLLPSLWNRANRQKALWSYLMVREAAAVPGSVMCAQWPWPWSAAERFHYNVGIVTASLVYCVACLFVVKNSVIRTLFLPVVATDFCMFLAKVQRVALCLLCPVCPVPAATRCSAR